MPKGGFRIGAGRPKGTGKFGEPSAPVRVPLSKMAAVEALMKGGGNFNDELQALMERHNIQAGLYVVIQNPDATKDQGNMMITVEGCATPSDLASSLVISKLKTNIEAFIPTIFGNAELMRRNG